MKVSIRCAKVKILTSDSGGNEIVVILEEVNEEDLTYAFGKIRTDERIEVEGIEPLELPKDFKIIMEEGNGRNV